jgi:hypothetical protein
MADIESTTTLVADSGDDAKVRLSAPVASALKGA